MAAPAGLRRVATRTGRLTIGLVAVVAAVATGAVVTGVFAGGVGAGPPMPPQAAGGQPVVEQVSVDGQNTQVVVVPHRPGPNLVWVDGENYRVGTGDELVPAQRRAGAPGAWALVDLPAGPTTLWVERDGRRAALDVHPDPAVPALPAITTAAGPECLSAVVGAAIAGATPPERCPNQTLAAADRKALRAMVRSIADRGVPGIRLVGGDSPRAAAAERVVRREAARLDLPVNRKRHPLDARVVVADWAAAENALNAQVRRPAGSGVYLAPWLGNGTLLGYSSGAVVVLNYDTTAGPAADYIADLDRFAARTLASPAGFTTWLSATGRPAPEGPPRLYAALAGFSMMGVDLAHRGGGIGTGGWVPNGRLTTVSKPLVTR